MQPLKLFFQIPVPFVREKPFYDFPEAFYGHYFIDNIFSRWSYRYQLSRKSFLVNKRLRFPKRPNRKALSRKVAPSKKKDCNIRKIIEMEFLTQTKQLKKFERQNLDIALRYVEVIGSTCNCLVTFG